MLILQAFLQTAGQIIFNCELIFKNGFRLSPTHLTCRLLNIYLLQAKAPPMHLPSYYFREIRTDYTHTLT
ncbi:MAG TPA: hypothetical protein PKM30_12220 [Saprospiraceae bacterium]|jgi:hypothetical protein|nr:hypothetical protein [Candidatus Parvibacillus calidus]MBX2935771.1 hypothetical protein [Saprospiraceae bacterium]MBX7179890.1 hypothetical protein [Saprospiraceae bacterium]MCC7149266.1 hypothetical protein [Saprospiraceae bacterium]MCO5284764.1 hypothetical protein [Saprospiraceae bacterium]